jgi:hypothetical protein
MTHVDNTLPGDLPVDPPDVCYLPRLRACPVGADLALYLSLKNDLTADTALAAQLDEACEDAADRELARLSCALLAADGADPPNTVPGPVARAILARAAALWRRRNSVNGFDGFDDLGTVPVRTADPDIEAGIDRWRAWSYG